MSQKDGDRPCWQHRDECHPPSSPVTPEKRSDIPGRLFISEDYKFSYLVCQGKISTIYANDKPWESASTGKNYELHPGKSCLRLTSLSPPTVLPFFAKPRMHELSSSTDDNPRAPASRLPNAKAAGNKPTREPDYLSDGCDRCQMPRQLIRNMP
jgi:hypothetical protein